MRIVAGIHRGRKLVCPEGETTRPTSERAREAIFNMLVSQGGVDDWAIVDLFAGTGALGLEALSRGASSVVFVENDRAALSALRENIAALGVADRCQVVQADAVAWAAGNVGDGVSPMDLVVADPPYGFDRWDDVLAGVSAGLVLVESGREIDPGEDFEIIRSRKYGAAHVMLLAPTAA